MINLKNMVLTESLMEAGLVAVSDTLHICESEANEGSETFWTSGCNRKHGFTNAVSYQGGLEDGGIARKAYPRLVLYDLSIVYSKGTL